MERRTLVTQILGVGVIGAFLQIAGANWDVSSHILGIVDTFFTTPHLVPMVLGGFIAVRAERTLMGSLIPESILTGLGRAPPFASGS